MKKNFKQVKRFVSVQDTALELIIKSNLGLDKPSDHSNFIKMLDKNTKAACPSAFCIDPTIDGKTYYSGSDALTIAFIVEALGKSTKDKSSKKIVINKINPWIKKVEAAVLDDINSFQPEFKNALTQTLEKLLSIEDKTPIIMFPLLVNNCLKKPVKNDDFLLNLSLISLYGWIAYTIYDDIMDNDKKEGISKLPIANFALRRLTQITSTLEVNNKTDLMKQFDDYMNTMEEINFAEINCDNFKQSLGIFQKYHACDKSLGHLVVVSALLNRCGIDNNDNDLKNVIKFFKLFLTIKQLNDDAHDWEEDFDRDRANFVTIEFAKKYEGCTKEELRTIFWKDFSTKFFSSLLDTCDQAEKMIRTVDIFEKYDFFIELLKPLRSAAEKGTKETQRAHEFIDTFYG